MLCAPAVIVMLLVTAYPIVYAVVLSLQRSTCASPTRAGSSASATTATVLTSSLWWTDVFNTVFIMVDLGRVELVLGLAFALVMHRAIFGRGARPHLDPDPLRDHHRGRRLRLAVTRSTRHRLRQRPAVDRRRHGTGSASRFSSLRGDHRRRDLEDHAVHGAAAARRAGARRRRAATRRRKVDGATRVAAASTRITLPLHEAGDHGRAAVPHARRVPDLRQRSSS